MQHSERLKDVRPALRKLPVWQGHTVKRFCSLSITLLEKFQLAVVLFTYTTETNSIHVPSQYKYSLLYFFSKFKEKSYYFFRK